MSLLVAFTIGIIIAPFMVIVPWMMIASHIERKHYLASIAHLPENEQFMLQIEDAWHRFP